jgi:hypothetical protein
MTEAKEQQALELVKQAASAMRDANWSSDAMWTIARAALSGSIVARQIQPVAPVLSSAAISDRANAERLLEPFLGPEANT